MWPKIKPYFLLFPSLFATLALFGGGITGGIKESLKAGSISGISFASYKEVLISQDFWASFFFTLRYAGLTVVFASLLALTVIFCLFYIRMEANSRLSLFLARIFQLPMLFPFLVAAYIIFILLSPHGWLSRLLFNLGIIGEKAFPLLVNDPGGFGIIAAYVFKTCPFIILMLYPVILKIPKAWLEASRVSGVSLIPFFARIVWPLLFSPLKMASFIVFAYTFLAFEVPYTLGVTYPKAIPVYSYQLYSSGRLEDRPYALAINIISLFFIMLTGYLLHTATRKSKSFPGREKL